MYIYIFTMAILYHVCFHEYFVNYTVTWMNKIHHDDHYCLIIIQPTFKITLPSFITLWTTVTIFDIFLDRSCYNRGMFIRAGARKFLQKIVLSIMSIVNYSAREHLIYWRRLRLYSISQLHNASDKTTLNIITAYPIYLTLILTVLLYFNATSICKLVRNKVTS